MCVRENSRCFVKRLMSSPRSTGEFPAHVSLGNDLRTARARRNTSLSNESVGSFRRPKVSLRILLPATISAARRSL